MAQIAKVLHHMLGQGTVRCGGGFCRWHPMFLSGLSSGMNAPSSPGFKRYATPDAIDTATVDEYLRTFSGHEGVLGALGVYRAAFTTMEQTAPLTKKKVQVPMVGLGGDGVQGLQIRKMVELPAYLVKHSSS
jgi:hypothetical protein